MYGLFSVFCTVSSQSLMFSFFLALLVYCSCGPAFLWQWRLEILHYTRLSITVVISVGNICRHVLKGIHLRQFLVHSSFSGNACVQSLGRNLQNLTLTCRLIHQRGKRPYLNENVSSLLEFLAAMWTPICSICVKLG